MDSNKSQDSAKNYSFLRENSVADVVSSEDEYESDWDYDSTVSSDSCPENEETKDELLSRACKTPLPQSVTAPKSWWREFSQSINPTNWFSEEEENEERKSQRALMMIALEIAILATSVHLFMRNK